MNEAHAELLPRGGRPIAVAAPSGSWRAVLEAIRDGLLEAPAAAALIGLELVGVTDGSTTFRYTPQASHGNPGHVHGGVLALVADFAVSTAVATTLVPGEDVVTADLHVSYFRRVALDEAPMLCTATVLHRGRSQANADAILRGADGQRIAHIVATCRIIPRAEPVTSGQTPNGDGYQHGIR